MAFFGVEVKPGKPFRQIPQEGSGSQLHLSNAVLGLNPKQGERSLLKCKSGDNPEIFLASLTGGSVESASLDIIISDDVVFSVTGSTSVHLTGYYMPIEPQQMSDDEFDEYGEEGEFDEYGSDEDSEEYDEYEEDDEEDSEGEEDEGILKHGNRGVKIEEILDDAAAADLPVVRAAPIVTETLEEEESDEEDEDGFERHHKRRAHKIVVEDAQPVKRQALESLKADTQHSTNGTVKGTPKTAKKAEAKAPVAETTPAAKPEAEEGKKSKKQKGDKTPGGDATPAASGKKRKGDKIDGVEPAMEKKQKGGEKTPGVNGPQSEKKKTKEAATPVTQDKKSVVSQEKKAVDAPAVEEKRVDGEGKKGDKKKAEKAPETKEEAKSPKAGKGGKGTVREFPNGLKIEELAMGKPDGKRAEPGKKILMQYVGKLAKNGKVFDASRGRPFSFRLGVGEVITGWDKGIQGMRVGDKRRLTIPPSMGYGARGAPPDIPGNATLVFDVELVNVK